MQQSAPTDADRGWSGQQTSPGPSGRSCQPRIILLRRKLGRDLAITKADREQPRLGFAKVGRLG